jgi:hypothetical protein
LQRVLQREANAGFEIETFKAQLLLEHARRCAAYKPQEKLIKRVFGSLSVAQEAVNALLQLSTREEPDAPAHGGSRSSDSSPCNHYQQKVFSGASEMSTHAHTHTHSAMEARASRQVLIDTGFIAGLPRDTPRVCAGTSGAYRAADMRASAARLEYREATGSPTARLEHQQTEDDVHEESERAAASAQHPSASVSIRQHTSAEAQHTSAYERAAASAEQAEDRKEKHNGQKLLFQSPTALCTVAAPQEALRTLGAPQGSTLGALLLQQTPTAIRLIPCPVTCDPARASNTLHGASAGSQFTCFTSTKVQILTPEDRHARRPARAANTLSGIGSCGGEQERVVVAGAGAEEARADWEEAATTKHTLAGDAASASAYVSIRQHTSAYVSIRQHTAGDAASAAVSTSAAAAQTAQVCLRLPL